MARNTSCAPRRNAARARHHSPSRERALSHASANAEHPPIPICAGDNRGAEHPQDSNHTEPHHAPTTEIALRTTASRVLRNLIPQRPQDAITQRRLTTAPSEANNGLSRKA
eukprot:7991306-Alexandrium_andersonii.AAC.1